jgi:hypothetical protein
MKASVKPTIPRDVPLSRGVEFYSDKCRWALSLLNTGKLAKDESNARIKISKCLRIRIYDFSPSPKI